MTRDPEHGNATTQPVQDRERNAVALLVVSEGLPVVVPLTEGVDVRIGRAPTADVVVDDRSLSRHHARFRLANGRVAVEDLASSNGTVVGDEKIAPGRVVELDVGDSATLGEVLVVVQRRGDAADDRRLPAASAVPNDELVGRIGASTISVLLLGETGVGKEVMAERIHAASPRRDAPLVKLNCAALSTSVLESELFGHERGAFTGAVRDKAGLIESADGGTLFLDEIGEADLGVQVKLLRVLETRETQRIGALRPTVVNVRFIAATNRTPAEQIQSGTLRADLYYRLAGFTITIPPLRERRTEIAALANELIARHDGADPKTLRPDAMVRLMRHDWPGNVRELRNVLDRALLLADGAEIGSADIDEALRQEPTAPRAPPEPADDAPPDPERVRILAAIEECGGNQSAAAEKLGISRRTLVSRLQAWGMTRPRRTRK